MAAAEQICPRFRAHDEVGYRRFLKRRLKRQRRRDEKRDPENAPVKLRFRGYSI